MNWYVLTITAFCEAESASAASQCWIDGDYQDQTLKSIDLYQPPTDKENP